MDVKSYILKLLYLPKCATFLVFISFFIINQNNIVISALHFPPGMAITALHFPPGL